MLQILLDYPSSHVRLALRVYFNIVLPFLGIIGDQCCKKRAQLKLLHGRGLDVTQTTGWLRGVSAAYVMYATRRSPAGWLGIIMIFSSILWVVADLVVSGFVVTVNVVDRCPFNTTSYVVIGYNDGRKDGPFSTGNIGAPWDIITGAVETSKNNGGLNGIFHKVNTDPSFRADQSDIIGSWHCQQIGQDSTYIARESPQTMLDDLRSRGLLYEQQSYCSTQFIGNNWYVQMAAWSSSVGDWENELQGETPDQIINSTFLEQWDVRAAIDMSPNPEDPKVMRSYQCSMDTTELDYIRGKLQAATTLLTSCNNLRSNIYHYFTGNVTLIDDPGPAIATTLNVIMMMAAAFNAGSNNPPPPISDPFQGCIAPRTRIPLEVTVTGAIITLGAVVMFIYWAALTLRLGRLRRNTPHPEKSMSKLTPNGLLGWMLQAVITTGNEQDTKYKALNQWMLLPSEDGQVLDLVNKTDATLPTHAAATVYPHAVATPLLADPKLEALQIPKHVSATECERVSSSSGVS
ncbi:hypothetical protein H2202_010923 [Exophiala xenobiotica]|nr:hypothetical protein H2202_010923 [Exophiala xenobiotica]KAK5215098.1 hypothetical protein LTR72_011828 [Exophiala xenobiotica]KAK5284102.1 hypothetical protein LTR14_011769 [Exophiala xenobiotica]KAK5463794.1 hypothetical protein LTR55_011817 [Exophiala xenobiotica]